MNWAEQVDIYCERVGPEFWAEPVNAVTNAAFLIAAFILWRRVRDTDLDLAKVLCTVLAAIGVGSFLSHTFATRWAATADVVPIGVFVFVYIFAANRDFLGLGWAKGAGATMLFPVFAYFIVPVLADMGLGASAAYGAVNLYIYAYGVLLFPKDRALGGGLLIGAGVLSLSIFARTIDHGVCERFEVGSHFLWHCLNALMLGWMIEVYRRFMLPKGAG